MNGDWKNISKENLDKLSAEMVPVDYVREQLHRNEKGKVTQTIENCMLAQITSAGRSEQEAYDISMEYLTRVGMADKADSYPSRLSGGQKQRAAIARALCMNPEMMLFDEPTSALDPEMIKEVLDVMKDLGRQGMTMIVVTHEMGFARKVGSRVVFLEAGEIIEENESEAFFSNPASERARDFLSKVFYD